MENFNSLKDNHPLCISGEKDIDISSSKTIIKKQG